MDGAVIMSHNKDMVSTETESKAQRKVFVPNKLLECLPRSSALPTERLRWNTNEEIASFLISFDRHEEWLCCSLKTRPKNGSIILYNRKKVKYRKDGYCWKKRKDGKTTREDHMKLKVQGMECLYGCYVHSSIVPTFHRRCYWLLQNPDIVLVHYLNVPSPEDSGKCSPLVCAVTDRHSNARWSRDDLLSQLKPMFHSMKCTVGSGDFTIEDLVQHILDRQRTKPQPRTHACLCNHGSSGANIPHRCNSTKHRIISPKVDKTDSKPTPIKTHSPVPSPRPLTDSSSSPPPTAAIAVSNYTDHHGNLTAVALPQNALIVMAAATPPAVGSANAALSRNNNNNNKPLVVAAETVTLLPPLLLTPPPPPQATPSPPQTTPPSPRATPPAFDPDAFLNSPKRGQTYGRPASNHGAAPAPSPASSLSSLSSTDSAPLAADHALALPLSLEFDGEDSTKNARDLTTTTTAAKCSGDRENSAPPTKVALIQSNAVSPRRHSSAPLLLVCQDSQPTNHSVSQPNSDNLQTFSPQPQTSPVQVKQESGRRGSDAVSVETPPQHQRSVSMDTDGVEEEAGLELSFDSPFPDLISDLIGEETPLAPPAAAALPPTTVPLAPPAAGVRYVVPPQPSPSTSFLPFPQPRPSTRRTNITDFSPEWSYPEGGVKVLITGPWSEPSGRYSCVFDQSAVPASLIQPGVLRCYCPAHEAGLVCLQVLESGGSVSSSVLFEYRARNASSLPSSQLDWLSLDDNQFRMSILERLEQMERRMAEMSSRETQQQQNQHHQQGEQLRTCPSVPPPLPDHAQWFERRIVGLCQRMMSGACWRSTRATTADPEGGGGGATGGGGGATGAGGGDRLHRSSRHRGMTLLHLAAAQGYTHLIHILSHWRSVNRDSLDLEQEVDPLNVDHFSCTPLMWACALGHQSSAELLYSWSSSALGIPDSLGRLPLAVARSRGHTQLATALELMHTSARGGAREQQRPGQEAERREPKSADANNKPTEEVSTRKRSSDDQQNGAEKQHKAEERTEEQRRNQEEQRRNQEEQTRNQEEQKMSQEEQKMSQEEQKMSQEEQKMRQEEQKMSQEEQKMSQEEQKMSQEEQKMSQEEQKMRQEEQKMSQEEQKKKDREEEQRAVMMREEAVQRRDSEEEDSSISVDLEEPHMTLPEPDSRELSLDSPQPLSPLSTSPDTGLSSSSSLPSPSPFDPASSPSLSSAYSSVGPAPMDTSPPESPSDSPSSLWGAESHPMEYESSAPPPPPLAPRLRPHSSLQQLLSLSQNQGLNQDPGLGPGLDQGLDQGLSENNENEDHEDLLEDDELQVDVAALAEQIIEATPERIKREDFPRGAESALRERRDNPALEDTWLATYLETVDPPRRLCPPSPLSALALHRLRPPSSAAWAEFLNASANGKIERDFALLTLTDGEQRELYEAARIIQTAFRRYKGRRLKEQQDMAAAVIQRCYRKYKQYALYKKMTQAAILIQSKFRSYYEQKRFQQSRRAAVLIQQYYRSYKEYERKQRAANSRGSFLTKKQDQAARKIMRFLRRCRHRIKELKQSRELERRGLTT